MAKLTKQESKFHEQCLELIHSDRSLNMEEKLFILEHYQESQGNSNALAGAFFTPWGLARDFSLEVLDGSLIDVCAGIGALSLASRCMRDISHHICVELNPDYAAVGRRIVPEAEWVNEDVFTALSWIPDLCGTFDTVISNPPFGQIKTSVEYNGPYTGGEFEYKLIQASSSVSNYGAFILPQMSAPFKYSGNQCFEISKSSKYSKFEQQTGIALQCGTGVDTEQYRRLWHGVSPICEIVITDFSTTFGM